MLAKILIANRGEIAVRVMRTCRELGITSVAVYSELDRDALHVRYADEAHALGGKTAAESYLNTERLLSIATACGADSVHPGYGFFAENADFARAVDAAGLAWIGPPPEAIEVMGDKISSRVAAAAAGVASVPGTLTPITDVADIIAFGDEHGWPVAIKAAFGGGGRGMKVCHDADTAASAFESAAREATAYFGRPEAYLERYLEHPRHIEMQVFCDTHGNAVWLGERDCSTQRRHQKLIEETPAAGLDDATRAAMGDAALKVARACGYVNAGTVEMLYENGAFFFLEMNTRLQVEHCVTEEVTRLDLVAEQIRIASGEALSFTQESVVRRGHAIECRINAENPSKGFLPSPGTITRLRVPSGPGVRWDGGYEEGDTISQFYDNLVGKLVVWAPDRATATARALRSLRELDVAGITTTAPAHLVFLSHPDWQTASHSTKWAEEAFEPADFEPGNFAAGTFAASSAAGTASTASFGETATDDAAALVERTVPVEVNGKRFSVRLWLPEIAAAPAGAAGRRAPRPRPTSGGGDGAGGNGTISAPMQGTIVKVLIAAGDVVESGQALIVLEAMKMENHINAGSGGTVQEVRVKAGDTVGTGDVLVVIT